MHKSTILGLSLVSMLFLAATTAGMSMQVSAIQEKEKLQSFAGSKKNDDKSSSKDPSKDKKFECKKGPFKDFYVADRRACNVDIHADPEMLCEDCIKYWLYFLNSQLGTTNPSSQTLVLINALATAINGVNFGTDEPPPGCTNERLVNPLIEVQCLPIVEDANNIQNAAQVFEICKQLELALKFIDKLKDSSETDITPQQALNYIEEKVLDKTDSTIDKVVRGLFECFRESLLPVLFPSSQQIIFPSSQHLMSQESAIVQQDNQENTVVEQQSIDQQQQQQIEQIKQGIQQSLKQEKQRLQEQPEKQQQQLKTNDNDQEKMKSTNSKSIKVQSQNQKQQQQQNDLEDQQLIDNLFSMAKKFINDE